MSTRETCARQYWTRNPLTGCQKGQMMRGILKGIKYLPSTRSDRSALNNLHNRKLQDYTKHQTPRFEQGTGEYLSPKRKYKCYLVLTKYASPDQNNLVMSVIDTYENTGPMHLSHKYPIGIVECWRENFCMHPAGKHSPDICSGTSFFMPFNEKLLCAQKGLMICTTCPLLIFL